MIAVSVQYHTLGIIMHMALPPVDTDTFELARIFADDYVRKFIPSAYNVTYSMARDDGYMVSTGVVLGLTMRSLN